MKQLRQNTLLVVTTLQNTDKVEVASELRCFHPGLKLQEALRLILSRYTLFREIKLLEDEKVAINLIFSKFQNYLDLKMIKFSELQIIALQTLIREINSGHRGLTNQLFLQSLQGTLLYVNKAEYFGKIGRKPVEFKIKMYLRKKRKHFERFIGVGYKDKGTAKSVSWDGFHSWQEITSTGEAKLNEVIRANSQKLLGRQIRSARFFRSIDLDIDRFGNPVRAHLEKVIIDDRWIAWREYHFDEVYRPQLIEILLAPVKKQKFKEKLRPARDPEGVFLYIEGDLH